MRGSEIKFVKDLISLVGNAVATGTIPEAEDYLTEKYANDNNEIIEHTFNVLNSIHNKQTEEQYGIQSSNWV